MLDLFLILTPMLLLAIVALLGFVGCYQNVTYTPPALMHVETTVKTGASGTNTISADPLTLMGGELIIVTVQWKSASATASTPSLTGTGTSPNNEPILTSASFAAVAVGGAGLGQYFWNGLAIQSFWATNPQGNTSLTVKAALMDGSNPSPSASTWNLCVSAYSGAASATAPYSPEASDPGYTGPTPTAPAINLGPGDMLYAVGFAADPDGTFPGSTSLAAGPGLSAEFPAVKNPLVEDGGSGIISAQVTSNNPSAEGFIVAMGLKSAG